MTRQEGTGVRRTGSLQTAAKAILKPFVSFAWRVHVDGAENVPRSGGAILAPNHTSVLDSFFVPLTLKRRITYVGKAEYLDDWKTRHLFPALGMIPIDRRGGDSSTAALDRAVEVLGRGELFGIYPEGTRSRDGVLHKGHTGVARLALRTGAPIVPVGIIGTVDVQPPDVPLPRPFRQVVVRFGRPIDVDRYADRANDRLVLRQITDEVMFEIRQLSGQDYENTYATKASATDANGSSAATIAASTDPAAVGRASTVAVSTRTGSLATSAPSDRTNQSRQRAGQPSPSTIAARGRSVSGAPEGEPARSSADVLGTPAPFVDIFA